MFFKEKCFTNSSFMQPGTQYCTSAFCPPCGIIHSTTKTPCAVVIDTQLMLSGMSESRIVSSPLGTVCPPKLRARKWRMVRYVYLYHGFKIMYLGVKVFGAKMGCWPPDLLPGALVTWVSITRNSPLGRNLRNLNIVHVQRL